jgi:DnaJ-class molecular chaperone
MAVELAKDGGALPEFLAEIAKPRRRVCPRCEGDGMIGDGYLCEPCNGTGYDRLA